MLHNISFFLQWAACCFDFRCISPGNVDKMQGIMSLRRLVEILFFFNLVGCATLFDDYDKSLLENKEFDKHVKVKAVVAPVVWGKPLDDKGLAQLRKKQKAAALKPAEPKKSADNKTSNEEIKDAKNAAAEAGVAVKHEPSTEDPDGFIGRRPVIDPFREHEEVTYAASYFAVEAGTVTLGVKPFVQVNGKKAYHFYLKAKSSSVFSMFYAVDDYAEAFLDYEKMIPYSYSIKARETKQVRDVKTYFNWDTMKAQMWDKKIKRGKGPEEKNITWDILPFSQNVFTVAFYMRCFSLKPGKEVVVRVAHEGQNIMMTAKVVREEKLTTPAGTLDTVVIKPQFTIDGAFKPVGDVFIWLTNDDRKLIVRIESKIKIGTVVIAAQNIKR